MKKRTARMEQTLLKHWTLNPIKGLWIAALLVTGSAVRVHAGSLPNQTSPLPSPLPVNGERGIVSGAAVDADFDLRDENNQPYQDPALQEELKGAQIAQKFKAL